MKKIKIDYKQMVDELEAVIQYLNSVFGLLKIKYDRECEKITIQISNIKYQIKQLTKLDIAECQQCDADNLYKHDSKF